MDTIDCPKCEHEHQPSGSHEDDSGAMECEECGFRFKVEIEYDPSYSTSCVEHKFGHFEVRDGFECRFCEYCQECELKQA